MLTLIFAGGEAPRTGRKVNEWLNDKGEIFARAFSRERLQWIDWLDLGVFAFTAGSNEVRVWPEPDIQHAVVLDIFSRVVQPLILQASGWQLLHAGAALGPSGVFAFCGRSRSGKSTLAFAMRSAGWRQFADDALVLRPHQNRVMACPIPFTPQLRTSSRAHFAHGSDRVPSSLELQPADAPLRAVYVLEQDTSLISPRISLVSRARAFSELLTHAEIFFAEDPKHTRRLVESYLDLAACVPVFMLKYRPNFNDLPLLTRAIVDTAGNINIETVCPSELRSHVLQS